MAELSRIPELGRIILPSTVIEELEGLSRTNSDARIASKLYSGIESVRSTKPGDDGILEAAISTGCSVITNDSDLIARAKSLGIRTYSMRNSGMIGAI